MSVLADILRKHHMGQSYAAHAEVLAYLEQLQSRIGPEWEIDQAFGVLEVISEAMGLPVQDVQRQHSEYIRGRFDYWAGSLCSDRARLLRPRIDEDDIAAFAEAQSILALAGIIGFTSVFLESLCRSMSEFRHRTAPTG